MSTRNDKQHKQAKDRRIGQGCLTLFALPFAIAGLVILYLALAQLWLAWDARSWVPVDVTLDRVELVTHSSSDGNTYEVEADYHFDYAGRRYTSSAVTVDGLADSNRERHQRIYRQLKRYQGRSKGYSARMDPDDPQKSLLITRLDWTKVALLGLMGLLFGGVGLGLIIGGAIGARSLKEEQQREQQYPEQPWLWKKDWRDGAIRSDDRERLLGIGIFALIWNAISAPLPFVLVSEWQSGNQAALIGLLFPLIGLILAGVWGKRWWHRRRFGELILQLDPWPGRIGGQLQGAVAIPRSMPPGTTVTLTLSSVRRRQRGSGKNRKTVEDVLWQKVQLVTVSRVGLQRSSVPVRFVLPAGLQPSDWSDSANQQVWRLQMKAELDGIDLDANFEVPVFEGDGSLPTLQQLADAESADAATLEPDLDVQLAASGIQRRGLEQGGFELFFPPRRHPVLALVLLVVCVTTAVLPVTAFADIPLIFRIVLWLVALLFGWLALTQWFQSYRISVWPGRLRLERRFLGRARVEQLAVGDFDRLQPARGMTINNRQFHRIKLLGRDGKTRVIGDAIEGLYSVQRLISAIEDTLTR